MEGKAMDLLQRLQKYYESKGISAENFACPHYKDCKKGTVKFKFRKATEAFVGPGYQHNKRNRIPRLLFITAGPGGNLRWSTWDRGVYGIREYWLNKDIDEDKEKTWWYRTNAFALIILKKFKEGLALKKDNVKYYFAYTDSEKCSQNKKGARQNDKTLFKNCRKFIPGEVKILRPDIIITQGDWARAAMRDAIKDNSFKKLDPCRCLVKSKRILNETKVLKLKNKTRALKLDDRIKVLKVKNEAVLWIHTYHPDAWGDIWSKEKRATGEAYSLVACDFMNNR
jgi:uracil-DNA glycosylase